MNIVPRPTLIDLPRSLRPCKNLKSLKFKLEALVVHWMVQRQIMTEVAGISVMQFLRKALIPNAYI